MATNENKEEKNIGFIPNEEFIQQLSALGISRNAAIKVENVALLSNSAT